jgi:sugar/nucleoside kinase (ribokinase family)
MKNFDLAIYGNLILDRVYFIEGFMTGTSNEAVGSYSAAGSTGNMLRAFRDMDPDKNIKIIGKIGSDEDGDILVEKMSNLLKTMPNCSLRLDRSGGKTSSAVILSDVRKNTRTSIVEWGVCRSLAGDEFSVNADWSHLMYLDTLDNINRDDIKKLSKRGIVSADLCLGRHPQMLRKKIFSCLEHIDYLILSDVEAKSLVQDVRNGIWRSYCAEEAAKILGSTVKKAVIVHSPHGSTVCSDGQSSSFSGKYITDKSLNVLGAGDIFAASFINRMIEGDSIAESVTYAHNNTTTTLRNRGKNEKI